MFPHNIIFLDFKSGIGCKNVAQTKLNIDYRECLKMIFRFGAIYFMNLETEPYLYKYICMCLKYIYFNETWKYEQLHTFYVGCRKFLLHYIIYIGRMWNNTQAHRLIHSAQSLFVIGYSFPVYTLAAVWGWWPSILDRSVKVIASLNVKWRVFFPHFPPSLYCIF